jgi:DNA-binding MarR family transcriptional regulator
MERGILTSRYSCMTLRGMDAVDRILDQWRRERPDLDVEPMGPLGRLGRLRAHLLREMERTFAEHGLNYGSFDVLATLRRSGPPYRLSPGDLLATMMITSGTLTNRLDQLEKAGMIRRSRNPDDGRGVIIELTDAGYRTIEAAVTDHVATQARLVSPMSADDRATLDRLLRTYLAAFEPDGE